MASFRKRGKTWTYIVEGLPDPATGKRNQIPKGGFKTKAAAETAAARLEVEIADGTYVKESKILFEDFCKTWLEMYKAGIIGKKPKKGSIRQRKYQIAVLKRYFAKSKIGSIIGKRYQEVLLELLSSMGRNTVVGIHGVAKMIFRKAKELGEIKHDPTEYAKVPEAEDEEEELPKYMEKDELAEFLRLAKHRGLPGDYEAFLVLAYTGMRPGELCVLKWSDIDSSNQSISINGTLYNPDDKNDFYEIGSPKTKKSKRVIDVDPFILAELDKLKARQNEFKMSKRNTYHDAGFVFARMDDAYGYPPKIRTLELRMDRLTQWMNLPIRLTPHSLRHTHTSLCAEAGVSLEAIMQRLGHKNDTMTRTVYLHVTKTVKKEASEKFSALMSNVVKM